MVCYIQEVANCIVYCSNIQQCKEFKEVFEEVLDEYHGLDCEIDIITQEVTQKKRNEILNRFEKNGLWIIHLICSVRILDEGIDLPTCDSEFIMNISENTSWIRTIQRLMRFTKDKNNLNKTNNMFVWCDLDDDNSIEVFSALRTMDKNFPNKFKLISKDYDKQKVKEIIEKKREENKRI